LVAIAQRPFPEFGRRWKTAVSQRVVDAVQRDRKKRRPAAKPWTVTCVSPIPVQRGAEADRCREETGMSAQNPFRKSIAAFGALAMLGSSAASAAPAAAQRMVDPFAVVSIFGTADSAAAICAGSSAAAAAGAATAASGQAPGAGCVLPMVDAPPPPVVETPPPPEAIAPVVATCGGVPVLPLLVGLLTIAALAAVLLRADEDGEINLPISP
jgi:hypothetical protein